MINKASARKNGQYGYKAVVRYPDGRTHIPVRKNFRTREQAIAYAQKYIDANAANYRENRLATVSEARSDG